ncbi:cob(I)yrinic acid a,c-diamide adenosyltransferase [Candidatus Curtissbacteria bacterium]|nr:cob(I)yrinic acid a,c-diamide adenosyltransferase [Candidatus Curtissbacteria bacterium]
MKIYTKTGDHGTTSLFGGKRVDKSDLRIKTYGEVDELNSLIGVVIAELHTSEVFSGRRQDSTSEVDMGNNLSLRSGKSRRSNLLSRHSGLSRIDSGVAPLPRMTGNTFADTEKKLFRIQSELLVLGSDLATPMEVKVKVLRVKKSFVTRLEKEIDSWSVSLPQLRNFILPGGGKVGAQLHLARTVARRAERSIAELDRTDGINKHSLRSSSASQRTAGLKNALIYINRLSDWLFTLARYVNKLEGQSEKIWKGRGS